MWLNISVVAPFRSSISVFCYAESMRFPLSVPWLFPKGGRRTHCLKSTSPPILPTEVLHTRATATGEAHTLRSTTDRGTCTTFHATRYIRPGETSRLHVLTTAQHTTYAADCHLTQPKRVRLTSPTIPTRSTSSTSHAMRPKLLRYASILYKVQTPPIHSPISNSAAHPLKFFGVRISLRCTTAHPLITLASKPIDFCLFCRALVLSQTSCGRISTRNKPSLFSRCKHLMCFLCQKEVALLSTARALL